MAIENWTDVDYAQAAIDMLPGSVEEIAKFLPAQKVKNRWENHECPVHRHLAKWTDNQVWVGWSEVTAGGTDLPLPEPVREYILWVDRQDR